MGEKKARADLAHCPDGRLLRRRDVEIRTGISESVFTQMEKKGLFPNRRRVGARAVAWVEQEITDWIKSRPTVQFPGSK